MIVRELVFSGRWAAAPWMSIYSYLLHLWIECIEYDWRYFFFCTPTYVYYTLGVLRWVFKKLIVQPIYYDIFYDFHTSVDRMYAQTFREQLPSVCPDSSVVGGENGDTLPVIRPLQAPLLSLHGDEDLGQLRRCAPNPCRLHRHDEHLEKNESAKDLRKQWSDDLWVRYLRENKKARYSIVTLLGLPPSITS